ncbi:MAG: hypothetical protein MUF30_03805 [Burkholderiales bacterium]|jgi:hypothetical protein|nr:hypothetical protein [Burkholderiales bacterium]
MFHRAWKGSTPLVAAALIAGSAVAAEPVWQTVDRDALGQVFVDRASITHTAGVTEADVLVSFTRTQTVGDDWYPHRSRVVHYRLACESGEAVATRWTFRADELGSGEGVWAAQVPSAMPQGVVAGTVDARIVEALCAPATGADIRLSSIGR